MHTQPRLLILCVKAASKRSIHPNLNERGQKLVKAKKQDLDFTNVTLRVATRNGDGLTEAKGVRNGNGVWSFHYPGVPPKLVDVKLSVEALTGSGIRLSCITRRRRLTSVSSGRWGGAGCYRIY